MMGGTSTATVLGAGPVSKVGAATPVEGAGPVSKVGASAPTATVGVAVPVAMIIGVYVDVVGEAVIPLLDKQPLLQ